jgi:hypothetical protein
LKTRILQREFYLQDGNKITAKVKIAPTTEGALTTEDQKTYYALVRQWEEQGRPNAGTPFSLRRLAKILRKRWGNDAIETITKSLSRLRGTLFTWENSFFDKSSGETIEFLDTFNIISELKIIRRKKDGAVNKEMGYFKFNNFILKNLFANYTKPLLFDVVFGFRSEIAQLLYTHIDLMLCDKTVYERRSKELFEDLGITGTSYDQKRSKRKQVLEPALAELRNVPLSKGGLIVTAMLEETKDKKDYKVIFGKGNSPSQSPSETPGTVPISEVDLVPQKKKVETSVQTPAQTQFKQPTLNEKQGEVLVSYFNEIFFNLGILSSQPRHIELATELVAKYGLELAKFIVEFAYQEASRTNFQIATFGGIAQYIDRAVAAYSPNPKPKVKDDEERFNRLRGLELDYREYCEIELDRYLTTAYAPLEVQAMIEEKKRKLLKQDRKQYSRWQDEVLTSFARQQVQKDVAQAASLLTFEEFCSKREVT